MWIKKCKNTCYLKEMRFLHVDKGEICMFEKFGEMDSYKEINELAENLFNEGDVDSLRVMAKENGIPDDFVEMYLEGMIPELCDLTTAAIGKLDKEAEELKLKGLMLDWVEYIKGLCMQEVMIAHQVRKQGKKLKGCMAVLLKFSFENRVTVDKEIVNEAKIKASRVDFGVPGMADAKRMIREYYLGGSR